MRQVGVGVLEDGVPFGGFCDGWSMELECFVDKNEDWQMAPVNPASRLAEHITEWFELRLKEEAGEALAKQLEERTDYPEALGRPVTIDDVELSVNHNVLVSVARMKFVNQSKAAYFHWIEILQLMARIAKDDELDVFILASTQSREIRDAKLEQDAANAAASTEHGRKSQDGKRKKRESDKCATPSLAKLETDFMAALNYFKGYPMRGERGLFWQFIAKRNSWWVYPSLDKNGNERYPDHNSDWPPNAPIIKLCEGNITKWRAKWGAKQRG